MKETDEIKEEETEETWEETARDTDEFEESDAVEMPEPEEEEADSEETKGEPEAGEAQPEDTPPEEEAASGDSTAGKTTPFRRKEKKDPKDEKIEELSDRVRRQMAEFDNFRKRTEKEKSQMFETGAKSVIEKILPIIDNFERGLAAIPDEEKDGAFADGMEKVYRQMMSTLEEIGVEPIEAEGQTFDPDLHNAVLHVEDDSLGENVIVEELQKGYKYRDSVVRHSMVKVAN